MSSPEHNNPVNPLPPVVVALFLVIAGIELAFFLGDRGIIGGESAVGWRMAAIQKYAFSGEIMDWMVRNRTYPLEHVIRFVSYGFVHVAFTQTLFASVFLLALGKAVGDEFGGPATLFVYVASGIGGAVFYWLILDDSFPLIGAYPHAYGLIGAFTYLLWLRLGSLGENQMRAFTLIGFLMGIQLVFGAIFGGQPDWVADVGGFATGFLASFFVSPGGWRRIRARIRYD